MSNSNAIKALVAIATCSGASAFVAPACLARTLSAPSVPSSQNARQTPANRGEAVAPLNGFSFSNIADIFSRPERESATCIPQDENADQAGRKEELEAARKKYEWDITGIPVGTPFLKGYPPDEEKPNGLWVAAFVKAALQIIIGTYRGSFGAAEILEALSSPESAKNLMVRLNDLLKENVANDRAESVEDYEDLHTFPVRDPDTICDWEEDDTFARLRLQGANCAVIKKASAATRAKLAVLDTDPAYSDLKGKVDSLLAAGKLFVVDHELLEGMKTSSVEGWQKYLTPGIALFEYFDDDLLPIKPIGIQLSQGTEATPIFMPEDGYNWQIAKACFEASEFIIHEVVSHLGNTHIVLEGVLVAMHRQLPKEHPLYDLIHPHLEGTAFINYHAQDSLITPHGTVDILTANDITETWDLCLAQTLVRIKSDFSPLADFENRGVTKEDFPGRYMYRDVGTQYWDATLTWVTEYMDLYYDSDTDLDGDYELQAFITEMTDTAQMKWLDEYKTSSDKKALIAKVFASFIYTASTLHAAVNFPQKTSMSFVPSSPGAMYAEPPADKSERTYEDYMSYLAPMEIAIRHVAALTLLGSIHHTELGDYDNDNFEDNRVTRRNGPLNRFQDAIEEIGEELSETNRHLTKEWAKRGKDKKEARNFSYKQLLPESIPQSINI